jgi:hypothetical protein
MCAKKAILALPAEALNKIQFMDRDVADVIKEGVKSLNRVSVVCNRSFR